MKNAAVRTRLVQMEVLPGKPAENAAAILEHVRKARAEGVELLVFPEMSIPGYLLGDEWEHAAFLRECEACGREVREASAGLVVVFGNIAIDWKRRNEDGRVRKYNAAFVAENGRFIGPDGSPYDFVIKTLLPNYREFDDSRHFYDLRKLAAEERRSVEDLVAPVRTSRLVLGCGLCEDAWDMDYGVSPLKLLSRRPVDLYINISASPFTLNKNHKRNRVFGELVAGLQRPLIYANHVGIQNNGKTVFTFDGASCIYDSHGSHVRCGRPFEDTALTLDIPLAAGARFGHTRELQEDTVADIHAALDYGTRRFLKLCRAERVVIGVSGGIDSAVVAALYSRIVSPENLLLVNMPGQFTSGTTRSLARRLAERVGCFFAEVPILDSVGVTRRQLDGLVLRNAAGTLERRLDVSGFVLENIQARDRSARVLAGLAGAFGGVFTCNANKSEACVGYTTLYGDLGGYLANIADLWKTEVYALARYLNRELFGAELIPQGSIDITPSAELSPAQNVEEGKGDPIIYPYHDCLFRSWVEWWNRATPEDVLDWYAEGRLEERIGYSGNVADLFPTPAAFVADLERWWNQYQGMGVAKRIQAPPILAVKKRAFGFDHRESQMGPLYTRRYHQRKAELLA